MTRGKFFLILTLVAVGLFVVFVWPTRYHHYDGAVDADGFVKELRVDRLTGRVDAKTPAGGWVQFAAPREVADDPMDTPTGHAVGKAEQAGREIRKMNEVAGEAIDKATSRK